MKKIIQHFGDHRRRDVSVGDAVDLDHRGQRAAAQAGDLFDRKQPPGVGIFAADDPQLPLQGVLDRAGPFHVAGRAMADADDVASDWAVAKLRVEGRHAGDHRRGDLGRFAHLR